ncbi:ubiquinol-cytochrome c reductase iron-sulfur subunit [Acidihalobacter prosperus]|uniref:Ubiquinol-cytochrome c reductase iron-sulfur subunit n=1 Tax=Acidihalobacter prosperus TaxID=160660 RepID=A0A1A6C8X2_9GAMM|nr:ubiquinol-cytochrome c reductase iron-sulfur subunit [Acidihalobacter prosperus]OBS11011.1 ubiquinol-cytochrome c reductase iron-sulfur subunit [Acidihalobacter prosperus]
MARNDAIPVVIDSLNPEAVDQTRRRFLIASATVVGAVGVAAWALPFIESMEPDKAVTAAGVPIDVDISKLEPGQLIIVEWRQRPIWILNRQQWMLDTLVKNKPRLKDPESLEPQQPTKAYVNGVYRSLKKHVFVAVAICTHLQCSPNYAPKPKSVNSWWPGGFHCPCHGSMYDFSARVFDGSPAPLNIPIPPYFYKTDTLVRIGETEDGKYQNWVPAIW